MKNNNREMIFNKEKVAFKIQLFEENLFVTLIKFKNNQKLIYSISEINKDKDYRIITRKELNRISKNSQLIGFNNNLYDDYLLPLIASTDNFKEIKDLSDKLKKSKKPAFLWEENKPKSQFGTFDIKSSITKKDLELSQLSSIFSLKVEDDTIKGKSEKELIEFTFNKVETIVKTFNHPAIQGSFRQRKAMIEKYLPGEDWAISQTDAALAARALTNKGKLKITKKKKFDWTFKNKNVLEYIPKQWKDELISYASRMEDALIEFENKVKQGMSEREAGRLILKQVPSPEIDSIKIGNHLLFKPSLGGAHTAYVNKDGVRETVNAFDTHHRDIQGAYGALAVETNLFGEATPRFKQFLDDKFKAKRLKSWVATVSSETSINSESNKETLLKEFNIDMNSISEELLNEIVDNEVSSTKLATNSPTGKADEPGSPLYNPIAIAENRIILQILLYLATKLVIEKGGDVFSDNTDGLFYSGDEEILKNCFESWSKDWGLKLDYEYLYHYIGKDDNSRLILDDENNVIEASGDLSHQFVNPKKIGSVPRIVDVALIQKLKEPSLSIKDIVQSIANSNQVDLFAWTLKATKNHKSVIDYKITQNVNRVLLTKNGVTIGNYSIIKDKVEAFTNLPETKVKLINDGIPTELPSDINLEAYIEVIEKAYSNWL